MIVDMLRNDLSVVAELGTVKVPKLYEIEPYPTVYQMTSTITAKVAENKGIVDIFKALFPCASITGAPKVSTMKIIDHLEKQPREVYCGAIGYISPNKEAVFNVPIRTVLIDQQKGMATYGVGEELPGIPPLVVNMMKCLQKQVYWRKIVQSSNC